MDYQAHVNLVDILGRREITDNKANAAKYDDRAGHDSDRLPHGLTPPQKTFHIACTVRVYEDPAEEQRATEEGVGSEHGPHLVAFVPQSAPILLTGVVCMHDAAPIQNIGQVNELDNLLPNEWSPNKPTKLHLLPIAGNVG